ncbi:esterase/lipase family protein [Amycolatopsis palatopharyngis]|uniref:esterase/lipase family protein n=1 Tax=Amycolatopsis palatopharyngis TaxID=187982 RepID=UPI001FE78FBD|nr:lipase family protein [Amycolatopsis palatopharyngis]
MNTKMLPRLAVAAIASISACGLVTGSALAAPAAPTSPPPQSLFRIVNPSVLPLSPPTIPDEQFAPVDQPGPTLSVPQAVLDGALKCTASARDTSEEVVLFVPGTTLTPEQDYGWNWFPALDQIGRPYCSVTLPNNAMTDAQISAEYVVNAIRKVYETSGNKVDIVGHSQGGTEPRFALRFWPDLRDKVDDYIGLGATNHGSIVINAMCVPGCSESMWQQKFNSHYTQAINSYQETFPGISYTQIYTRTDEFVQPNLDDSGTTSLHGGGGAITNVALQDVCPTALTSEHLAVGTYDPIAYALARDALDNPGPAEPKRIDGAVCGQLLMPGVDAVQFPGNYAALVGVIADQLALAPKAAQEPKLKPYTLRN